jgi:energy-coupling factor transporter ATP-binding protein EcfA2
MDVTADSPQTSAEHPGSEEGYSKTSDLLCAVPPPTGYANVAGVMHPLRRAPTALKNTSFVSTPTTVAALHAAATATAAGAPLLLLGPAGSGKSSLAAELAARTGNSDMLALFCDDSMDARALLGAYVCASTPGEFFWRPGPLAAAATAGTWVVLEGFHLAPVDVVAVVNAFAASGHLHVPQRGETVSPHPNFRILATVQTTGDPNTHAMDLATEWWRVCLPPPTLADRVTVLSGRFHASAPLLLPAMALAEIVRESQRPEAAPALKQEPSCSEIDAAWLRWRAMARACMEEVGMAPGKGMVVLGRVVGTRDVAKLLERLTAFHGPALDAGLVQLSQRKDEFHGALVLYEPRDVLKVSVELRQAILLEASEVLCGFASSEVRILVPPQDALSAFLELNKVSGFVYRAM